MPFRIALCSSDPALRAGLDTLCRSYFSQNNTTYEIIPFSSAEDIEKSLLAGTAFSLCFAELNSFNAAESLNCFYRLRSARSKIPLAIISRSYVYAPHAFRVNAIQYLLQPLEAEELYLFLDRVRDPGYGPYFSLESEDGLCLLPYRRIEYLECARHIVRFHLRNGDVLSSLSIRVPISQYAEPLLNDPRFIRVHRSYIVNLAESNLLTSGEIRMFSGSRIPVAPSRESDVRAALLRWGRFCSAPFRTDQSASIDSSLQEEI